MRIWLLVACIVVVAVCLGVAIAYAADNYVPTIENDHLLDGVPGLGGPKG